MDRADSNIGKLGGLQGRFRRLRQSGIDELLSHVTAGFRALADRTEKTGGNLRQDGRREPVVHCASGRPREAAEPRAFSNLTDTGIQMQRAALRAKPLLAMALTAWTAWASAASAATPSRAELAGEYDLAGGRESRGGLELAPDGRFRFGVIQGGVDATARGVWSFQGTDILLTTDPAPKPRFEWLADQAGQADNCLGHYGQDATKPVVLVACVATPEQGIAWEGVAVSAEFANGRTRSGETSESGQLGFLARPEPEWAGIPVVRLTVAYPEQGMAAQSFDVPANARTAVIKIDTVPAPAFQTAVLHVSEADESQVTLSGGAGEDGDGAARFTRIGAATAAVREIAAQNRRRHDAPPAAPVPRP